MLSDAVCTTVVVMVVAITDKCPGTLNSCVAQPSGIFCAVFVVRNLKVTSTNCEGSRCCSLQRAVWNHRLQTRLGPRLGSCLLLFPALYYKLLCPRQTASTSSTEARWPSRWYRTRVRERVRAQVHIHPSCSPSSSADESACQQVGGN